MAKNLSIKEAERRAYQLSTSQDGLYDVFLGLFILLESILPLLDENGLPFPWNLILIETLAFMILGGVFLGKKFLIAPRIGLVKFGSDRKKRLKRLAIGMAIIFLLTVGLFVLTLLGTRRGSLLDSPIQWPYELDLVHTGAGIFILGIFSLIGYMNDHPRMYLYGALFGFGYILSTYIQDQTGTLFYWPFAISGLVVAIIGLTLFSRFLQKYPLQEPTH